MVEFSMFAVYYLIIWIMFKKKFKPEPKLKLMDQVSQVLRYHHNALNTERKNYLSDLFYIKFQVLSTFLYKIIEGQFFKKGKFFRTFPTEFDRRCNSILKLT